MVILFHPYYKYILHSTHFNSKHAWHIAAQNILVEKTLEGLAAMYGIY